MASRICFRFGRNLFRCGIANLNVHNSYRFRNSIFKIAVVDGSSVLNKISPFTCVRCYAINVRSFGSDSTKRSSTNTFGKVTTGSDGETDKEYEKELKEEEEELKKKRDAHWKTMKMSLIAIGSMFGLIGSYMVYALGSPKVDEEGNLIEDEFSALPIPMQLIKRTLRALQFYNKMLKEPASDKLLPDPLGPPYQPPYTLILELSDLLVHPEWTYQTGWRFKKRPGVDKFLEQVSIPLYEVVVFTSDQPMTMYPIIDALDSGNHIIYRLFRDSTDFIDGHHVKNLDCLNRDLSKVIVIDWNKNSVKLHRNNAFLIPRWNGQDDDTTLVDLAVFLRTIAVTQVDDVRDVLTYYSQFDNPIEAFRENQRKLLEQMEENEEKERKKKQPLTSRWTNSFIKRSPTVT